MKRFAFLLPLLMTATTSVAEPVPLVFGDPFDLYIDELVTRSFGPLGYCSPPGQQKLFRKVDARIARIRSSLVTKFSENQVQLADDTAKAKFQDAVGSFDIAGCKIGDDDFDRKNYLALKKVHNDALHVLEVKLGLGGKW